MLIYSAGETAFTSNGLGGLSPNIATVNEQVNGRFELYIEHPTDEYVKFLKIQKYRVIKTNCHKSDDQLFRIYRIDTEEPGKVKAWARQIFYDLLDNFIEDTRPTIVNANTAGNAILNGCQYASGFTFTSAIAATATAYYVRINPVAAFIGTINQSMINRWGGEIERNNKAIELKSRLGTDTGMVIKYRKNLAGLMLREDDSAIFTRLMPIALNSDDTVLNLPEKYVDSARISDYPNPKITLVDCKDIKVGQEVDGEIPYPSTAEAYTEMRARCATAYASGIDLPLLSLDVEFVDWSNISGYEQYSFLFNVELGDTVTVDHERLGIDKDLRVIEIEYDCLLKRYIKLILGENMPNLAKSVTDIDVQVNVLREASENALLKGEKYNSVSIDHINGFASEATVNDADVLVRMNATNGFEMYVDENRVFGINSSGDAEFLGKVTIGSGTGYDTGYDPSTKETPEGAQAKADAAVSESQAYVDGIASDLQSQIDGSITSWFYGYVPTTSNVPASGWTTTDQKNQHLGDLFYDTTTGYSYRFQLVSTTYSWARITDTDVTKALADAAAAQDTADSKRRVFAVTPTPPYDAGDLWTGGSTGDLKRCKTAKAIGAAYSAGDWELASKYTDNTVANQAIADALTAHNLADAAQGTANTAVTNAAAAQTTANSASTNATNAINQLTDITADNKIVALEKQLLKKEWDAIAAEKAVNDAQADQFGITAEKSTYGTKYTALNTYINTTYPLFSSLTTTTTIDDGATLRLRFKEYYDARTGLLNAIAAKAKTLADTAQTQANTATTNAATAQSAANAAQSSANTALTNAATAQTTANTAVTNAAAAQTTASTASTNATSALTQLTDIAADNKITPNEKQMLKKEWDAIAAEKTVNDTQADLFGVTTEKTAYGSKYTALNTYVNSTYPLFSNLTTTTTIDDGATLRLRFKEYYDARTGLLNAISAKAKTLADAAQAAADSIQIGGRNLIIQDTLTAGYFLTVTGSASAQVDWFYTDYIPVFEGEHLIASGFSNLGFSPSTCYYDANKVFVRGINNNGQSLSEFITINSGEYFIRFSGMLVDLGSIKLERGNRATDWTPAPEDTDVSIAAAQSTADTAITNAATAQSTANTAVTNASTALTKLSDIASDAKITSVEKLQAKMEWDAIVVEGTPTTGTIPVQALAFGVADTDFDTDYAALNTYLNTTLAVFTDMAATTSITRSAWDTAWKNYYDERTKLLNAIAAKAKTLADTAQSAANAAQGTANTALSNAATAQSTANGRNKVFYQTTAPTASAAGDTWFDTDDGNKIYKWSGSAWTETLLGASAIADASITTAKISLAAITNALIADATISSAKIASLNAAKIIAGIIASADGKTCFDLDNSEIKENASQAVTELIDSVDAVEGTLSTSTGAEGASTVYGRTGYFAIEPSTTVTTAGTLYTCYKFFYTSAKAFISYSTASNPTAPANAAYVRLRFYNAGMTFSIWKTGLSGTLAITVPVRLTINPTVGLELKKGDDIIMGVLGGASLYSGERMLLKRVVPVDSLELIRKYGRTGIIFDENFDPSAAAPYAYIQCIDKQAVLSGANPIPYMRIIANNGSIYIGAPSITLAGDVSITGSINSNTIMSQRGSANGINANSIVVSGIYLMTDAGFAALNFPTQHGLLVVHQHNAYISQTFHNNLNAFYTRFSTNAGTAWSAWAAK